MAHNWDQPYALRTRFSYRESSICTVAPAGVYFRWLKKRCIFHVCNDRVIWSSRSCWIQPRTLEPHNFGSALLTEAIFCQRNEGVIVDYVWEDVCLRQCVVYVVKRLRCDAMGIIRKIGQGNFEWDVVLHWCWCSSLIVCFDLRLSVVVILRGSSKRSSVCPSSSRDPASSSQQNIK